MTNLATSIRGQATAAFPGRAVGDRYVDATITILCTLYAAFIINTCEVFATSLATLARRRRTRRRKASSAHRRAASIAGRAPRAVVQHANVAHAKHP